MLHCLEDPVVVGVGRAGPQLSWLAFVATLHNAWIQATASFRRRFRQRTHWQQNAPNDMDYSRGAFERVSAVRELHKTVLSSLARLRQLDRSSKDLVGATSLSSSSGAA